MSTEVTLDRVEDLGLIVNCHDDRFRQLGSSPLLSLSPCRIIFSLNNYPGTLIPGSQDERVDAAIITVEDEHLPGVEPFPRLPDPPFFPVPTNIAQIRSFGKPDPREFWRRPSEAKALPGYC
jgi:hypothetical protein